MPRVGSGGGEGSGGVPDLRGARAGSVSAGIFQYCADVLDLPGRGVGDYRSLLEVPRRRAAGARARGGGEGSGGRGGWDAHSLYGYGRRERLAGRRAILYVVLHVKEHSFFEREGNDLQCVVPISFTQAAMGTEIVVPTLDGEHKLKVPEGTQSGTSFRIRGKGVPVLNGHGKGDLFVEVRIQTPAKLSKRQRELLAEFGELAPVENKPQRRSLLGRVKDMFV